MNKNLDQEILSIQVTSFLSRPFRKRNIIISNWLLILLVELIAVLIHSGFSFLIYGNTPSAFSSLLWAFWGAFMAGFIVILVEYNLLIFLDTTEKLAGYYDEEKISFRKWQKKTFRLKKQIWFSIIFAAVIFPTTYIFFKGTMGDLINIGTPILYINLMLIGNGFYWLIFLPGGTFAIKKNLRKMNFFDLRNTDWINLLESIYERAAMSASIVGVMIILPVAFGPKMSNLTTITIGWLILVWCLVLIPYIIANNGISNIVNSERLFTMTKLQEQIAELLSTESDNLTESRLGHLLSIYDKATNAKNKAFSFNIQIFNSVVFPLISFVIINFDKIAEIKISLFK